MTTGSSKFICPSAVRKYKNYSSSVLKSVSSFNSFPSFFFFLFKASLRTSYALLSCFSSGMVPGWSGISSFSARLCDLVSGLFVRLAVSSKFDAVSLSDWEISDFGGRPGLRCAPVEGRLGGGERFWG